MIFAILFVIAFIIGLVVYQLSEKWITAVLVSTALFVATTLADTDASDSWGITFIFGLPIVFVASIFGAYVVELRRGVDEVDPSGENSEGNDSRAQQPEGDSPANTSDSVSGNGSSDRG